MTLVLDFIAAVLLGLLATMCTISMVVLAVIAIDRCVPRAPGTHTTRGAASASRVRPVRAPPVRGRAAFFGWRLLIGLATLSGAAFMVYAGLRS